MVRKTTKNKKKSWKRIDVQQVEEHLENERLKERLGPTDSKISFVIDNAVSVKEIVPPIRDSGVTRTRKLKTTSDLTSNLKCFESLSVRSKVPAIGSRAGPKLRTPKLKLPKNAVVKRSGGKALPTDLWSVEKEDEQDELVKEQLRLCGKHKVKAPASVRTKPNLVAAVQLPHPGVSYNPSDADFKALVNEVVREEVARVKKEERIHRSVTKYYQPKSPGQVEAEYMQEMTQGLGPSDDDGDDGELAATGPRNKAVQADDRKTKKQRNREQRVKQAAHQLRERKEKQKRTKQPLGLPKLLKEIRKKEAEMEKRKEVREVKLQKRLSEPKRRNSRLLPEQVVPDPADMTGSLRTVKVAGNLLEDRFGSLVARSLIEVKKAKRRKSRKSLPTKKLYVKRSHRTDVC